MIWLFILYLPLAVLLFLLLSWYHTVYKYRSLKSIPGPEPWPIIGNVLDLGSTPVELFNSLKSMQKKYGNIYRFYVGNIFNVVLTEPKHLEHIFTSTVQIKKSYGYDLIKKWIGDGLITSTGNKWRGRRKLLTPSFHFKILDKFFDVFNSATDTLVNRLGQNLDKSIDIYPFINLLSLDILCETSLGEKINAQNQENTQYVESVMKFLRLFIVRFFSVWKKNDLLYKLSPECKDHADSLNILHTFSRSIIAKRKAEYTKMSHSVSDEGVKKKIALLDLLLELEAQGKLSVDDIKEETDTFTFAGHDTVSSAMSFTLYALSTHREIQDKLYEEIHSAIGDENVLTSQMLQNLKYMDMVIKESMRVYPPVPMVQRELVEDCLIDGYNIPKGTTIAIYLQGMNYLETSFPDPERFDPDRFLPENQSTRHPYSYAPFSAGPRNCIGQKYALFEMKSALVKVLQNYEILPAVDKDPPKLALAAILKPENGVYIRLKRRNV